MGDELYAGLLPWIVFAVVARSHGPSTTWAALAVVITAATILTVETKHDIGLRNTLVIAAIGFFLVLGAVSLFVAKPSGWYAQDARAVSALGFSAIAFGSLAFVPITEYYSRPNTRPSEWRTQPFRRVNVLVTLLWGTTFLAIAASHALAAVVDSHAGFTTLNWVLPIALGAIAAHRTKNCWDDYLDDTLDDPLDHDSILDLADDLLRRHSHDN